MNFFSRRSGAALKTIEALLFEILVKFPPLFFERGEFFLERKNQEPKTVEISVRAPPFSYPPLFFERGEFFLATIRSNVENNRRSPIRNFSEISSPSFERGEFFLERKNQKPKTVEISARSPPISCSPVFSKGVWILSLATIKSSAENWRANDQSGTNEPR